MTPLLDEHFEGPMKASVASTRRQDCRLEKHLNLTEEAASVKRHDPSMPPKMLVFFVKKKGPWRNRGT